MTAVPVAAFDSIARACGAGRFVSLYRNRPIGSETIRAEAGPFGRLRVRAETEIAVHRFALRQIVVAGFTDGLRPEWCTVEATVNSRRMSLDLDVGPDRAVVRYRSADQDRSTECGLPHPPLLLIDNCFVTHALAALGAARQPQAASAFLSLPACEDLSVTRSGAPKVLLGGREFEPPALSLHLTPELDEHVWLRDDWIERLLIPQTQMHIEWIETSTSPGGPS
jgi:hypothetical protein